MTKVVLTCAPVLGDAASQTGLRHGVGTCPVGRVPAAEIEAAVVDQLRAVFRQPEINIGTWKAAKSLEPDIDDNAVREGLVQFDPLWDELFPAQKARNVRLPVERVDIGLGGLGVTPTDIPDQRPRADGMPVKTLADLQEPFPVARESP